MIKPRKAHFLTSGQVIELREFWDSLTVDEKQYYTYAVRFVWNW